MDDIHTLFEKYKKLADTEPYADIEDVKLGDRVKFVEYDSYGDYQNHREQTAVVIDIKHGESGLPIQVEWDDEETSSTRVSNLLKIRRGK